MRLKLAISAAYEELLSDSLVLIQDEDSFFLLIIIESVFIKIVTRTTEGKETTLQLLFTLEVYTSLDETIQHNYKMICPNYEKCGGFTRKTSANDARKEATNSSMKKQKEHG